MMQKTLLRVVIGGSHHRLRVVSGPHLGGRSQHGLGAGVERRAWRQYTDPVPQALILTAIVIGFGMTAFQLVLAYRTYQETGTDNLDELRHEEEEPRR